MTTATAKRKPKATSSDSRIVDKLQTELDEARQQLGAMTSFLSEVQKFSDIVTEAKSQLKDAREQEAQLKDELTEVRSHITDLKSMIDGTNNGMLAVLEPGPQKFMPLFDRMEPADTKLHGKNAQQWRELPLSKLRLSPVATNSLIEADILFIGQLQDRILENDEWWKDVDGITEPIAAAIADKLTDFVTKGGKL